MGASVLKDIWSPRPDCFSIVVFPILLIIVFNVCRRAFRLVVQSTQMTLKRVHVFVFIVENQEATRKRISRKSRNVERNFVSTRSSCPASAFGSREFKAGFCFSERQERGAKESLVMQRLDVDTVLASTSKFWRTRRRNTVGVIYSKFLRVCGPRIFFFVVRDTQVEFEQRLYLL